MSRALHACEKRYPAIEKEATTIIESERRRQHFLKGRHFTLITDQRSISFMLDQMNHSKIKNKKILSWRLELSQLSYDVRHKPGNENVAPDAFSKICSSASTSALRNLNDALGHPGRYGQCAATL